MRLAEVTGFELRPNEMATDNGDAELGQRATRLVAFVADQHDPVYVSEEHLAQPNEAITFKEVSFKDYKWRRCCYIAVQLWIRPEKGWAIAGEWEIDLRNLRRLSPKGNESLILHTDEGPRVRAAVNSEASVGAVRSLETLENVDSALSPQLALRGGPPSTSTGINGKGDFGISSDSNTPSRNGEAVEAPSTAATQSDTLASRWFAWGWGTPSESIKSDSTEVKPLTSLSYSTLVDLWTLQQSLDDAQVVSVEAEQQLNYILPEAALPLREKRAVLERRFGTIRKFIERTRTKSARIRETAAGTRSTQAALAAALKSSITTGEAALHSIDLSGAGNGSHRPNDADKARDESRDKAVRDKADSSRRSASSRSNHGRSENGGREMLSPPRLAERTRLIESEQARLADELLEIFPIEPVDDGKFHFAIRELVLPSVFAINHYSPVQVGAALGFVAQVVVSLSVYLDVALPYPITVHGSQSFITDNISVIKHGSSNFPLWTRGALLYRVEYALYLLHKDIEHLMNARGIAVADLKQTLANLKNVLLVVSSKS